MRRRESVAGRTEVRHHTWEKKSPARADHPIAARRPLAAVQGDRRPVQKVSVSRGRASHDGRPYADMVVFNENGSWYVRLAGMRFGPCASRRQAIDAAIGTAQLAERNGRTARVQEQTGPADFTVHWPRPVNTRRRSRDAEPSGSSSVKAISRSRL
jgi:hypothetical protein